MEEQIEEQEEQIEEHEEQIEDQEEEQIDDQEEQEERRRCATSYILVKPNNSRYA